MHRMQSGGWPGLIERVSESSCTHMNKNTTVKDMYTMTNLRTSYYNHQWLQVASFPARSRLQFLHYAKWRREAWRKSHVHDAR